MKLFSLVVFFLIFSCNLTFAEDRQFDVFGEVYCKETIKFEISLINFSDSEMEFDSRLFNIQNISIAVVPEYSGAPLKGFVSFDKSPASADPINRTIMVGPGEKLTKEFDIETMHPSVQDFLNKTDDVILFWSVKVAFQNSAPRFGGFATLRSCE